MKVHTKLRTKHAELKIQEINLSGAYAPKMRK